MPPAENRPEDSPQPPVDVDELEDRLCTLAGRIASATAEFLRLLGEFDQQEGWAGPGVRSCAHWLTWRCGMALYTARDHVRVAQRLRQLPVTSQTFGEGRLSYSKVRALCRVATPATEAELVETSLCATASQVERMTRCIEHAAPEQTPHSPPRLQASPPRLRWEWADDGTLRVSGRLAPEDGAALLTLLAATAVARAETTPQPKAEQAEQAEQAEAERQAPSVRSARSGSFSSSVLGDASRAGAHGLAAMAGTDGPVADVVVHVDADLLTRLRDEAARDLGRAHLEDGPAMALAVIERLACDGGIRLTTHGSDGRTLDLGRRSRRPTSRQLQTLVRRDGGCAVAALGRQRFSFTAPDGSRIEYAPRLDGRCADVDETYRLVDGETLTPDWHGERLEPDLIIQAYVRGRDVEGASPDPCSVPLAA